MEKSKVYFCDLYSNSENRNMLNSIRRLFDKAGFNELIEENIIYYYLESTPSQSGNYWHYDENGAVVQW